MAAGWLVVSVVLQLVVEAIGKNELSRWALNFFNVYNMSRENHPMSKQLRRTFTQEPVEIPPGQEGGDFILVTDGNPS